MHSTTKYNAASKCLERIFNLSMNMRNRTSRRQKYIFFSTFFFAGRSSPRERDHNTQELDKPRKKPLDVFTFKQFNKNVDIFKVNKYLSSKWSGRVMKSSEQTY